MRVAIVGTGVSGLVAARLLHPEVDITVFEARARIGGHIRTVEVAGPDGGTLAVDTGFIVYNRHNYPLFTRLLDQLQVATQPSDMSFSVRCDRTGLEYNGSTFRQLFSQRRNLLDLRFHRMLLDILRFNREAPAVAERAADVTLGEYVASAGYSRRLAEHYLVPMGSALWSIPRNQVLEIPAAFFVRFFENHGMLTVEDRPEWRVVTGGSQRYVEALVRPFHGRIRTRTPVGRIERGPDGVRVDGEDFDRVVLACHSDQALALLTRPTRAEAEVLGALPYQENDVILHTDTSVLPRSKRAWGSWNYHIRGGGDDPATVTYNMNLLQSLPGATTYCVTLNATETVDPETILYRARYHHPVYTTEGFLAQDRCGEISGRRRTHFCGAYWGYGFHEDGVRSGVRVAAELGVDVTRDLGRAAADVPGVASHDGPPSRSWYGRAQPDEVTTTHPVAQDGPRSP